MGTAQQRLINLKASPKKPKEREMNEEMVVRFRVGETENTSMRGHGNIRMQALEEFLGEGSMPSKFPKETLNLWEDQRYHMVAWWRGG